MLFFLRFRTPIVGPKILLKAPKTRKKFASPAAPGHMAAQEASRARPGGSGASKSLSGPPNLKKFGSKISKICAASQLKNQVFKAIVFWNSWPFPPLFRLASFPQFCFALRFPFPFRFPFLTFLSFSLGFVSTLVFPALDYQGKRGRLQCRI